MVVYSLDVISDFEGNIGQTRDEYCGARDYDVIRFRNRCQLATATMEIAKTSLIN